VTPADAAAAPIGVFDSGLGGLSVVREMRRRLPGERIVYVGDSVHAPYGARSEDEIKNLSLGLARFLTRRHRCRGLVIACNTATAAAAETVRAAFSAVPVVGMEPAVKPAVAVTKSGVVGILATVGTLASARFAALLERYGGAVQFVTQPCPGLPEAVERGELETPETRVLIEKYAAPLLARCADTLVLGCTHYPVLRPLIAEVVGPNVTLIDTGEAVARRAATLFGAGHENREPATLTLYTTATDASVFARGAQVILGLVAPPPVCRLVWKNGELIPYAEAAPH
jgi:glutamate racemase